MSPYTIANFMRKYCSLVVIIVLMWSNDERNVKLKFHIFTLQMHSIKCDIQNDYDGYHFDFTFILTIFYRQRPQKPNYKQSTGLTIAKPSPRCNHGNPLKNYA